MPRDTGYGPPLYSWTLGPSISFFIFKMRELGYRTSKTFLDSNALWVKLTRKLPMVHYIGIKMITNSF